MSSILAHQLARGWVVVVVVVGGVLVAAHYASLLSDISLI